MALDTSVSLSRCFGHALKEADAPAQTSGAQLVSLVLDSVCPTSDFGTSWCRVGGAAQIFGTGRGEHRLAETSSLLIIMKGTDWYAEGGFAVW